jgi:hypothetical protein
MPTITMHDSHVTTIEQLTSFVQLKTEIGFCIIGKEARYGWIDETLRKFTYHRLKKRKEKSVVSAYIRKVTGLSKVHLKRLVRKHKRHGELKLGYGSRKRHRFSVIYGPADIALLIETDYAHGHLNGRTTQEILKREYGVHHHEEYKNISRISSSHLYNLRGGNRQYNSSKARWVARTKATDVNIGIRAKPRPEGKPGYLRVDTVHSGDKGGAKGAYHLNIVDEVTQWEMLAIVPAISERFLAPVVETLINLYPFVIHEFHSDNGSEFVNHVVAKLIAKLYARFTKSRARHSNDNALVESKNGSIIRKHYGHWHIPSSWAPFIDEFNRKHMNIYLNYHRPCAFAEDEILENGKVKKKYTLCMTPYDRLKSLKDAEKYLKPGITFEQLDKIALAQSDNEFAQGMRNAKAALFEKLRKNF